MTVSSFTFESIITCELDKLTYWNSFHLTYSILFLVNSTTCKIKFPSFHLLIWYRHNGCEREYSKWVENNFFKCLCILRMAYLCYFVPWRVFMVIYVRRHYNICLEHSCNANFHLVISATKNNLIIYFTTNCQIL